MGLTLCGAGGLGTCAGSFLLGGGARIELMIAAGAICAAVGVDNGTETGL